MCSDYYPPGAANDPRAPWNYVEPRMTEWEGIADGVCIRCDEDAELNEEGYCEKCFEPEEIEPPEPEWNDEK
jgi:hypothetical protein